MARVKNVGGGPGDEDPRPPPRLPTDVKGKATKKLVTKKRKYVDADTERAAVVIAAADHAEREEVLGVEYRLQINFHQHRGQLLSRLSIVMVVQLGLSCLRDAVLLWRSLSLRGATASRADSGGRVG